MITAEIGAPTIGIGAGPDCDGQVLVFHDLVNLTFGHPAKIRAALWRRRGLITQAMLAYKADVVSHQFPNDAESYHLPKERRSRWKRSSIARYSTASQLSGDNGGGDNVVSVVKRFVAFILLAALVGCSKPPQTPAAEAPQSTGWNRSHAGSGKSIRRSAI